MAAMAIAVGCVNVIPPPKPDPVDVTLTGETTATASATGATAPTASAAPVTSSAPEPTATSRPSETVAASASAPAPVIGTATATAPGSATATATASATASSGLAKLEKDKIVTTSGFFYDTGKATLRSDSEAALHQVRDLLLARADITLARIEVHTDSMGIDDANLAMSKARAMSVAKELVKLGIGCKRLVPVGFGETKPIAPNDTADNRAKNRRTEVFVAALRGKAVGGRPVDGGGSVAGDPCK